MINAYATTPEEPKLTSRLGEITSSTCDSWLKGGKSCSVRVNYQASVGSKCGSTSVTINFNNNGEKSEMISYSGDPNVGTGSPSNCSFSASVKVFNYDMNVPYWTSGTVQLSGATCDKYSIMGTAGSTNSLSTATCTGTVTAKITGLADASSGVPYNSMSLRCSPGQTCTFRASDNVGNSQPNYSGIYLDMGVALNIKINYDTTKCSRVRGDIYSGTQYNGYYVGAVKCSAKCTADNLAVGGTKYTTVDGDAKQCCAQACDRAGNCKSVCGNINRDETPPTCSHQNLSSDALINNYRMGTVTVSWKCS